MGSPSRAYQRARAPKRANYSLKAVAVWFSFGVPLHGIRRPAISVPWLPRSEAVCETTDAIFLRSHQQRMNTTFAQANLVRKLLFSNLHPQHACKIRVNL